MRDDDHAAGSPGDDVLEPGQAVEVEIVRRLVEQGEVEAGEQNGSQGHPRLLTAGERRHRLLRDVGREIHLRAGADEAGLEVPGRDRFVAGQCGRVTIIGLRPARGEVRGCRRELRLDRGHAGASVQGRADRLVACVRMFLGEVADGRGGRVHPDLSGRRDQQAGQDLQKGRLTDPVRADHAQAGVGPDGERHVVEHGVAPALVVEVTGDQCGVRCGGGSGHGELRDERDDGGCDRSHHGAAAGRVELYLTVALYRSVARLLEVRWSPPDSGPGCAASRASGRR